MALLVPLLAACETMLPKPPPEPAKPSPPSREQVVRAFDELNKAMRVAYERILDERGSRVQAAQPEEAFEAIDAALRRLGMITESRDPDVARTLAVAAPAPRPLDQAEWLTALQGDLPFMGNIICPILGPYCKTIKFDPEDFVIVITATVRPAPSGSEVRLTTRMREIRDNPTGLPRREYPPPTAVRMALNKIWSAFDAELAARQRRGR